MKTRGSDGHILRFLHNADLMFCSNCMSVLYDKLKMDAEKVPNPIDLSL